MNRTGSASDTLFWILRIAAAALLLFLLLAQILMITERTEQPVRLELGLYEQRLLTGPYGVMAREEQTGRVLPGVLDLARLDDSQLAMAYGQDDKTAVFGARLRVYLNASAIDGPDTVRPPTFNEPGVAKKYLALARAGLNGPGGGTYERHVLPVVLRDPKHTLDGHQAWLEMEMVKRT